jgi:hypothetical protein
MVDRRAECVDAVKQLALQDASEQLIVATAASFGCSLDELLLAYRDAAPGPEYDRVFYILENRVLRRH